MIRSLVLLVVLLVPSLAFAHAGNNNPKLVHACVAAGTGIVRIVGKAGACATGESAMHWKIQGEPGADAAREAPAAYVITSSAAGMSCFPPKDDVVAVEIDLTGDRPFLITFTASYGAFPPPDAPSRIGFWVSIDGQLADEDGTYQASRSVDAHEIGTLTFARLFKPELSAGRHTIAVRVNCGFMAIYKRTLTVHEVR